MEMGKRRVRHWILINTSKNAAKAKLMPDFDFTARFQMLIPTLLNNAKNTRLPNLKFHYQKPLNNATKVDMFGILKCQMATALSSSSSTPAFISDLSRQINRYINNAFPRHSMDQPRSHAFSVLGNSAALSLDSSLILFFRSVSAAASISNSDMWTVHV